MTANGFGLVPGGDVKQDHYPTTQHVAKVQNLQQQH
jgi:hypothetical protein